MLYIVGPILLVLSFMIEPEFTAIITGVIMGMYFTIAMIFNEVKPFSDLKALLSNTQAPGTNSSKVILRKKGEMVSRKVVIFYYMPYKFVLRFMNIVSV